MLVFELPRTSIYTKPDFKGTRWPWYLEITSRSWQRKRFAFGLVRSQIKTVGVSALCVPWLLVTAPLRTVPLCLKTNGSRSSLSVWPGWKLGERKPEMELLVARGVQISCPFPRWTRKNKTKKTCKQRVRLDYKLNKLYSCCLCWHV